jgi:hypothetical protein
MTLSTTSSLAPSVTQRDKSLLGRLVSAIRSQWPERTRGSPDELSDYLRRDIGLSPGHARRSHWDHQ